MPRRASGLREAWRSLRALVGDGYGLYLVSRRFEGGRLRALLKFAEEPSAKAVSTGELSLLLEGSSYTVHQRAEAWRPTAVAGRTTG